MASTVEGASFGSVGTGISVRRNSGDSLSPFQKIKLLRSAALANLRVKSTEVTSAKLHIFGKKGLFVPFLTKRP